MSRSLPAILAAAIPALSLGGCLHSTTMPVNLVSRAEFPPAERDAVWSRALLSLHQVAALARVDEGALVATTEPMTGVMQCSKRRCQVNAMLQVIVAPAGQLSARYNRSVFGEVAMDFGGHYEQLLTEVDVARLQAQLDHWVAGVIGSAGRSPPPGK